MVVKCPFQALQVNLNNDILSNIAIKAAFRESRFLFCDLTPLKKKEK